MLRADVVTATTAPARVVQHEGPAVGTELARADLRAPAHDRAGQAVRPEQLDRAVLEHPGPHTCPQPVSFLPFQYGERHPGPLQKMRGDQPRRTGPHDAHDRIARAHKRQCSPMINSRVNPAVRWSSP